MRTLRRKHSKRAQRGFSMVEMLLTAFILAVGIMGLTLLQVMSLKGARGGRSLSTAVQVGEMVMDQIEMEGRLSWLDVTASNFGTSSLTTLQYVNKTTSAAPIPFTIKGQVPVPTATDPVDAATFYNVDFVRTNDTAAASGGISNFTVNVRFSDQATPAGVPIPRVVTITRSILHG